MCGSFPLDRSRRPARLEYPVPVRQEPAEFFDAAIRKAHADRLRRAVVAKSEHDAGIAGRAIASVGLDAPSRLAPASCADSLRLQGVAAGMDHPHTEPPATG